jgi:dTDP-4-dehydrorhamnose 3,5-epimerase
MIDAPYVPGAARGARWDDPAFGTAWLAAPAVIADRDRDWPDFG